MIAHNVYVWRRRGAFENNHNIYDNVINGFPKREPVHVQEELLIRYWKIKERRCRLRDETRGLSDDMEMFGRRLA